MSDERVIKIKQCWHCPHHSIARPIETHLCKHAQWEGEKHELQDPYSIPDDCPLPKSFCERVKDQLRKDDK